MENLFGKINRLISGPEISIFHEFHKPPYGGGNTFLIALEKELLRQGMSVGRNRVGRNTKVVLFNSFNFDFERLKNISSKFKPKMIHRVDGPIGLYRGEDDEMDRSIWEMNAELANRTVFQSNYSLNKHREMGLDFKNPVVIPNASDPQIFNKDGRVPPPRETRKIRLIATAWSDNPNKGGPFLSWIDEHIDTSKYELTFVGRTRAQFKNAKVLGPVPSIELAVLLKQHDIYIAPSQNDPCSNALIEALTSGLPAVYLRSGGHPELVKDGGEGYTTNEEALLAIDKVANNLEAYQSKISHPRLMEVAVQYLKTFDLK